MTDCEIIRGEIEGKKKYCRIPVRSRTGEHMVENGIDELNAGKILEMNRELAMTMIDAIVDDWRYWMNRANELFVEVQALRRVRKDDRRDEAGS